MKQKKKQKGGEYLETLEARQENPTKSYIGMRDWEENFNKNYQTVFWTEFHITT